MSDLLEPAPYESSRTQRLLTTPSADAHPSVKTGPQAQQERRAFIEAAAPIGRDTFITKDGLVTSTGAVDYSVGAVQCDHLIDPRGAVSV